MSEESIESKLKKLENLNLNVGEDSGFDNFLNSIDVNVMNQFFEESMVSKVELNYTNSSDNNEPEYAYGMNVNVIMNMTMNMHMHMHINMNMHMQIEYAYE